MMNIKTTRFEYIMVLNNYLGNIVKISSYIYKYFSLEHNRHVDNEIKRKLIEREITNIEKILGIKSLFNHQYIFFSYALYYNLLYYPEQIFSMLFEKTGRKIFYKILKDDEENFLIFLKKTNHADNVKKFKLLRNYLTSEDFKIQILKNKVWLENYPIFAEIWDITEVRRPRWCGTEFVIPTEILFILIGICYGKSSGRNYKKRILIDKRVIGKKLDKFECSCVGKIEDRELHAPIKSFEDRCFGLYKKCCLNNMNREIEYTYKFMIYRDLISRPWCENPLRCKIKNVLHILKFRHHDDTPKSLTVHNERKMQPSIREKMFILLNWKIIPRDVVYEIMAYVDR